MKRCCACLVLKPTSDFQKDKSRPDGLVVKCRACSNKAGRECYQRNHTNWKARKKQWWVKNRGRYNVSKRQKAVENRDKHLAYRRGWYAANRERILKQVSERAKRVRRTQPERERARVRRQYEKHRARVLAHQKAYIQRRLQRDPIGFRLARRNSSARRRSRIVSTAVGRISYQRIMKRDRMTCHLCKRKVRVRELEFDHVIPLAKNGTHTEENIAVAHRSCNKRKSANVLTLF